ncbi:hypothetical protein [Kutzneria sp. CA-103260]|uniref:hypothetical protein n=1 Tax=Kutzneria sp. CA-103260 TaxID=2802641 RepID=UPI001BA4C697|nr:hypothetical protein [Kutzneria sp. CA-103260]QUQ62844.1 hypothetical protein JJ691_05560 [Kutzneria sp. CA-103260]
MTEVDLVREFITLRRGRGLHRADVHRRIGRAVARWADIPADCGGADVRRLVNQAIGRLAEVDLLPEDRRIVLVALGLDRELHAATLSRRTSLLAADQRLSERTARRRVDDAFVKLAQVIAKHVDQQDPERGWAVRRLRVLVRLDRPAPEVIEERTVVATRDGLDHIVARFSVPRRRDGADIDREVDADIQHGVRIVESKRFGANHFWYLLALPRPLAWNEAHTYTIVFQVRDGEPIADHYVFNPLVSCSLFETRVRFDAARRPVAVWRTDRAVPRTLPHRGVPDGPLLPLDGAHEVEAVFDDPEQGFSYGVSWRYESD